MKRFLAFLMLTVMLGTAVVLPAGAADTEPSDFLSSGELADRVYQKPDLTPVEGAFSISSCDDRPFAVVHGEQVEKVDSDTGDEFLAFVGKALDGQAVQIVVDLRQAPIDLSDCDMDTMALRFQFYVSDPAAIKTAPTGEIELTSEGKSDYGESNWTTNAAFSTISAGWNTVCLPFSSAGEKRGPADYSNINYFRTYMFLNADALIAIDNVEIISLSDAMYNEDFEDESALDAWHSDLPLRAEDGALALTCGSGSLTTYSELLGVLSLGYTALELSLKADTPMAVRSLSVTLTDEDGKTAKQSLDIAKLSAQKYHLFVLPISDMTMQTGFNAERIEELAVEVEGADTTLYIDRIAYKTYAGISWKDWLYDYEVEPGAYSIAVIPDIQELSASYPDKLNTIMQWIADNAEKENILFVTDMGDVTWNGHLLVDPAAAPKEFQNARNGFDILKQAGLEFSISYGNHDYTPASPRNTDMYNEYFPYEYFSEQDAFGGAEVEGRSDNLYYYVSAPQVNYLIVALEYSPDDATIKWANEVIAAHPDHTVIVTVHDYLKGDGSRYDSGTKLWNNLLKKHENIQFLLCGHDWSTEYSGDLVKRRDKGDNGNYVYQIMTNAQDIDQSRKGVGTLLMLRFSEDGNIINFNYFSPVSGYAFREVNQFTLDLGGTFELEGVEDEQVFCGSPTLSIQSEETVTITYGSHAIPIFDGEFTLPVTNKKHNLTVSNAFGRLTIIPVTVNETHEGGTADCDTLAVCEHCGESYGDYAHVFDESGVCTLCASQESGAQDLPADQPSTEAPADNSITLAIIIAGAILILGAVVVVLLLKKKK